MCCDALLKVGTRFTRQWSIRYSSLMTPDLIHALTMSGGILIGVVVLIIIITIATVNRGRTPMADEPKHGSRRH